MGILESEAVVAVRRPIDLAATGICWVGYGAMRAGSMRFARRLFLLALTLSPRHAVALRWLAWCLRETGDISGAIPYYRELLRLHPSFADGHVELGFAFSSLERYPEALEQFRMAVDQSPRDRGARGGLAVTLMALNHSAEALPVCEALVRDDPADSAAWGFLARLHAERGRWEDALAAYETAEGLRSDPLVAAEQASVLMELERYVDAQAVLKTALATHSGDRTLRVQLACVFVEHRRYPDAKSVLDEILREDPMDGHARQVLATLFANSGQTSEAAAVADGLVADFPDDPRAHATLGWVSLKADRTQDALTAFEKAIEIETKCPASGMARLNLHSFMAGRGTALKRLGRHSEVEPLVTAILERDPTFFERHAEWAELRTLRKLGDESRRCGPNWE
jgi:tetratricopeptide (TPR) repeat protein